MINTMNGYFDESEKDCYKSNYEIKDKRERKSSIPSSDGSDSSQMSEGLSTPEIFLRKMPAVQLSP
jgi:hypothetical protein